MGKNIEALLKAIIAVLNLVGGLLLIYASRIEVRDSQDDFISDLQRLGDWTGYGALAVGVAALAAFALWVRELLAARR